MLDIVDPELKSQSEKQAKADADPFIICKRCQFTITRQSCTVSPEGYHEHMQCNPQGHTFVFRCFNRAPGCHIQGKATDEFSWFHGYSWQFALCQGCGEHLGWYFSSLQEENFFGLIAAKITEKS